MFGFINPQATAVSDPVTNIRGCGPERLHRTTHMKGTSEFTSAGFPFRPGPHSGSNHLHFSLLLGFSTVHPLPSFLLNLTSPCTYTAPTFFFNLSLPVFCVSCTEGGFFTTEPLGKLNNKITLKELSLFSVWFYNMLQHEYYLVSYRDAQDKFYDLWPFHRNKSLLSQLQSPSSLASCLEEFLPYIKHWSDLNNLEFLHYGFFLFIP